MKVVKICTFLFCIGVVTFFVFALLSGCAEIKPPTPEEIMREPLGQSPLRIGMSKEKVKSMWGEPDVIRNLGSNAQSGAE